MSRKILLIDFMALLALNLAFLGFSVNGISAELSILPYYDFLSIPVYQTTFVVMVAASFLISIALYKNRFSAVLFLSGLVLQVLVVANVILDRATYEPIFLTLSEDPGLHNAASVTLQTSFYVAPWYEIVDSLTFIFFVIGAVLLFAILYFHFGIVRSFVLSTLAGAGLLLYFEYVTLNPAFSDGSASSIPSEKLTNFSNSWPLIGGLTNIELFWVSVAALALSGVTFGLLIAYSLNARKTV